MMRALILAAVRTSRTGARELRIGVALPPGQTVDEVRLNGQPVRATRGLEVTVRGAHAGTHSDGAQPSVAASRFCIRTR